MRHSALIIIMLLSMLMMQGCEQGKDLQPQDYFEGAQLDIAKAIYEGERQKLNVSKETLNRPAKAEMTLLFWAINNAIFDKNTPERLKFITDLVKAGADPLQPQPNTPGSPAEFVMKADKGIWIQAMLEGGLSPNARDKVHNQPIIFESFEAKNTETLKVLIAYKADVNIKGAMNRTPLINALYNSSPDHIEVLLAHGANPLTKDDFNDSFFSLISAEIAKGDKNNSYIKKLIKIKDKINTVN